MGKKKFNYSLWILDTTIMEKIDLSKAYYIKLGQGNIWAEDSITNDKIRIGWKRYSVLGERMEFFDLILEEIISKSRYGIQIKTKSSKEEFDKYSEEYNKKYSSKFDKFIFIVHSPDSSYTNYQNNYENVELWDTEKLSELTIELGLLNWILKITQ